MKAVRWHGTGDIRLDDVPEPTISEPTEAIIEITTAATGGTCERATASWCARPSAAARAAEWAVQMGAKAPTGTAR